MIDHLKVAYQHLILLQGRQLAIKWPFSFLPYPVSASALPGKNKTNKILHFYPMWYYQLIKIMHRNIFCSHFWDIGSFGWHFIHLFFQLPTAKLLEMLTHYANTGMEVQNMHWN